jgi:hypothetical protein
MQAGVPSWRPIIIRTAYGRSSNLLYCDCHTWGIRLKQVWRPHWSYKKRSRHYCLSSNLDVWFSGSFQVTEGKTSSLAPRRIGSHADYNWKWMATMLPSYLVEVLGDDGENKTPHWAELQAMHFAWRKKGSEMYRDPQEVANSLSSSLRF